jgi:DNA-binding LytR/AlgR family response regulator
MQQLKCIITDDEHYARKLLENYVSKLPQLELVGSYKDGLSALAGIQSQQVDLIFLDIQMPDLKGTDLLKTLPYKPLVIFTTAYEEYALEGYELDVVDYLVKPFLFERFVQAVNKAIRRLQQHETISPVASVPTPSKFEILKTNRRIYKVAHDDILYIEGLKEYVTYYTKSEKIIVLQSLKHLEQSLPQEFIRIHRSYIVNTKFIKSLYGNQLDIGEKLLPVGKSYLENMKLTIFNL